jgi:hypothetical protein
VLVIVSTQPPPHCVSAPQPAAQLEARHTSLDEHDRAQPPQWFGSDATSTQAPEHDVKGGEQSHCPPVHDDPVGHALSQAPQWFTLVVASTHAPLQSMVGAGQAHAPSTQRAPAAQALPQAPQFATSLSVSTHVVSQRVPAPGHAHAPLMQERPLSQAFPHVPQLLGSAASTTHAEPPHVSHDPPGASARIQSAKHAFPPSESSASMGIRSPQAGLSLATFS